MIFLLASVVFHLSLYSLVKQLIGLESNKQIPFISYFIHSRTRFYINKNILLKGEASYYISKRWGFLQYYQKMLC